MTPTSSPDPFGASDHARRPFLYVVGWPVYRAWLELAANGLNGQNPDWDVLLHEKINNAKDNGEVLHWKMVWEFGLRYGLNKREGVEMDGNIFREPEYRNPASPLFVSDDGYERVNIAELARSDKTRVLNIEISTGSDE